MRMFDKPPPSTIKVSASFQDIVADRLTSTTPTGNSGVDNQTVGSKTGHKHRRIGHLLKGTPEKVSTRGGGRPHH